MLLRIAVGGLLFASLGSARRGPAAFDVRPTQGSARTADQLIAQFRRAHETRATGSILRLVYWGTAEPAVRRTMERSITADLDLVIKRISLQPLAPDETLEYTQHGVTYRPTLQPVGRMNVEFIPQPGRNQQVRSSSYLVGVKDKVYFLLTAAPVTR
jgi:hypothetical protein